MDRINALLEELELKAADSSNTYELIMKLVKETSLTLRASRGNDGFLGSEVIGKAGECGQL
jgi:hypothetical protein